MVDEEFSCMILRQAVPIELRRRNAERFHIDDELGVPIREEFEVHLKICKDCTIFVQQTKLTIEICLSAEVVFRDLRLRGLHQKISG